VFNVPLTPEERANLRPEIDAVRLERFLDRLACPVEMRAGLLEAVSEFRAPQRPRPSGQRRPAFLPAQADDFVFEDPEWAAEWAAIAAHRSSGDEHHLPRAGDSRSDQ
jgi:hypothetical protein